MQFRRFGKTEEMVSTLAFGCMRYPRSGGRVDEARTEHQIGLAIERGINYFDTAYIYDAGKNETVLGAILSRNGWREKVFIADKLPPYLVHSKGDMENILETQLKRLQTDYIDFYLIHALNDFEGWQRLKEQGVLDFIHEGKAKGKIKHIGFSFHGEKEAFKKIVDDYDWEFVQIQYNYLDEFFQAGREGLEYAYQKDLGVAVMEPLRGGLLTGKIPPSVERIWSEVPSENSPAAWALSWIWNHSEVATVLSGMNEEAHIEENVRVAERTVPKSMTLEEEAVVSRVRDQYKSLMKIGCTGCNYCMPCPVGVNIPMCFGMYNTLFLFENKHVKFQYAGFATGVTGGKPAQASLCVNCGKCEKVCPQHLPIRSHLKEVTREMESGPMRILINVFRGYVGIRDRFSKR